MSILVIDVGSSAVRAGVVRPDGTVSARRAETVPVQRPTPGMVELDAAFLAQALLEVARGSLAEAGPVEGVGVTNQRGTTVVWDAATGEPVGPALSWQDLRTVFTCLELQGEGLRLAPNESATKLAWLLDTYDPERRRDLRFGTLDTWVIWQLSGGQAHITDRSNAAITGLLPTEGVLAGTALVAWDPVATGAFPGRPGLHAGHRHFLRDRSRGQCPSRRSPHLRHSRRPAGLVDRTGLRPAR